MSPPYPYPVTNTDLIRIHDLQKHPEGGYFNQTLALSSRPPPTGSSLRQQRLAGPGAVLRNGASEKEERDIIGEYGQVDATVIYYLLTPDSYQGRMHMNLHSHLHIHHAGRALYILIKPPTSPDTLPSIHRVILGPDIANGEVTQLFVPGGWWKSSEIPQEDLSLAERDPSVRIRIGCLISEVVIPGWNIEQHQFINEDKLKAMWGGQPGWEEYKKYLAVGEEVREGEEERR